MWIYGVEWLKENGSAQWRGRIESSGEWLAHVHADDGPSRFIAKVFVRGESVHASEHACLCEAQKTASDALLRAKALREGVA